MNLLIEVTKKCNLYCDHCLRGNMENKSIKQEDIEILFSHIQQIDCLTLSGGEPALVPNKIQMILAMAEKYGVDIFSFYIATNGTIASKKFLQCLFDLWCYCSENEISSVDISNDVFHDQDLIEKNLQKFKAFSFIKYKYYPRTYYDNYEDNNPFPDYFDDYNDFENILPQGRGMSYSGYSEMNKPTLETYKENPGDFELYLNCNGNLILGCDWSYDEQENHKFCHVSELEHYIGDECLEDVENWIYKLNKTKENA